MNLFYISLPVFLLFHLKKKKIFCRIVSVLFCVALFLLQESMFQWIRNRERKLIKVSILQEPNSELNISLRPMEHLKEEPHGQYPLERNPNAYRSMRNYRNPPWVSTPSYMVPPTNVPHGNAFNPSWGNHTNSSWDPRAPQYAPPPHPQYASSFQP